MIRYTFSVHADRSISSCQMWSTRWKTHPKASTGALVKRCSRKDRAKAGFTGIRLKRGKAKIGWGGASGCRVSPINLAGGHQEKILLSRCTPLVQFSFSGGLPGSIFAIVSVDGEAGIFLAGKNYLSFNLPLGLYTTF